MPIVRLLQLLLPLVFALPVNAADTPKTLRLATLEWLPYVGTIAPQNGLSAVIAAAAAGNAGYELDIEFFDWTTAMQKGEKDPAFDGYFPEYYTAERGKSCHTSQPIGSSTLGLATLQENTFQWKTLEELNKIPIGVVEGYSNGEGFDTMVREGKQLVEVVVSDTINLRKLLDEEIRVIAIDREVLRYLLSHSPRRADIVFNQRPLAELALHVCFKRTPAGKALQEAFDAGLQKLDRHKIEAEYMKRLQTKTEDTHK